jgi:DNA topoisomerase IB
MPSRYDTLLDEMDGEQAHARGLANSVASQFQPDAYAKAVDLSTDAGIPAHVIARNPEPYEKAALRGKYDALLDGAPVSGEWLTNVDNAAIAQDDIASITGMEKALRALKSAAVGTADIVRSVPAGAYQATGGALSGLGAINDTMSRAMSRGIRATGLESIADFLETTALPKWADPGRALKSIGQDVKTAGKVIGAPEDRQNLATEIASGLGQVSAQVAFQLVTGGASSTVSLLGQGADQQLERATQAGASQEQIDTAVLAGAGITAITERYGIDKLLDRVPPNVKNAVMRKLLDVSIAGGQEALQEVTEGILHNITAAAIYDPTAPIFEGIEKDAMVAGGTGAVARAILQAIVPGRQGITADHERATAERISEIAQQSHIATRSPKKLEELVAKIKEATGTEHAYVDAEAFRTLFQSDEEAASAAADMTGDAQTYYEAAVSGGKMAIPLEKYVSRMATDREVAKILDHVAFSPDGQTAAEAKESREGFEAQVDKISQIAVDEVRPDSSQAVYDDALGQLIATGMERSTAEKNATLMQSVFRTLGQRTGMDPVQIYERYGLKIQRHFSGELTPQNRAAIRDYIKQASAIAPVVTTPAEAAPVSVAARSSPVNDAAPAADSIRAQIKALDAQAQKDKLFESDSPTPEQAKAEGEYLRKQTELREQLKEIEPAATQLDQSARPGFAEATEADRKRLRIPPAWTDVAVSADQTTALQAIGIDKKGRRQYLYSAEHTASALREKFDRQRKFDAARDDLLAQIDRDAIAGNESAAVLRLIARTGFRIGGKMDGLADKDAYGATTLRASHVVVDGDIVRFDFPGKKGVQQVHSIAHPDIASDIAVRVASGNDQLFSSSDATVRDYLHRLDGSEDFKVHDFRTWVATDAARASIESMPVPVDEISFWAAYDAAGDAAAGTIGDTRKVALESYVDPFVFQEWRAAAGVPEGSARPRRRGKQAATNGRSLTEENAGILRDDALHGREAAGLETILEQSFNETKRGSITFGGDRQFNINLFEKADLSTVLHESGHFYLEILGDLAGDTDAPQQVKDDYAAILKWFGVQDRDSIGVEQHEQFARGFEAYLMEGKSPSVELQNVFARFRAWLTAVYRTLAKLNVELTDEVRGVMDRLVATDEEIKAAEESQNYAPIFTSAEAAGMTPEQWSAYQKIAIDAHQEAVEVMTDRAMRELTREQKAWWKEELAKTVEAVTIDVNAQPAYQALAFLKDGKQADGTELATGVQPAKLSKAALVDTFGKDFIKRLPRGVTAKDGIPADVAAALFGFDSGTALVESLANARPKKQLIEMEAAAQMREKYGDVLTDGSITEVAMKSVHTDGRAKVMAAELKALNRKRREVAPFVKAAKDENERKLREAREANEASIPKGDDLKAIKAAVGRIIQAKKVRDIQPNQYRMAEAKAARKAFALAGKNKFEEAYIEKRKQILNHELYRAAVKAREEVDHAVDYMRRFDKKSVRERIARAKGEFLEQIDALRERFDFSNVSNIADLKRTALAAFVAEQEAQGREINVPEYLLNEAKRTPYKELLFAELQGLHDAVVNLEHVAKTKDKLLKNKKAAEWQDAKAELLERVETSLPPGKAPPLSRFDMSKMDALGDKAHEVADSLLRPETIIEWLDGGTDGPWHQYLWNQANDSQDARETLRDQVAKPLFDLSKKISRKRRNELQQMVSIPSMGRALNRRTLISIALNMGNASNLDKLTRGGYRTKDGATPFTEQNLTEIKAALTAEDWAFVQTVWDTVEQLWPAVVAFQKRMGGLVPEKVTAVPVQTPHGEFKGGYFPLVYDPEVSAQGEKQAAGDSVQEILGGNFTKASTKKGHTQQRTKVARPILLDFERVVTRHMDQVITDLTHREFLLQASRILEDGDLRAQIQNRIGDTAYRSLQGMVRHAVRADSYYGDPAASAWMRMQDFIIRNTAVGALGFRAVTAFGNLILAPVQASARIPPANILKGIGSFYRRPRDMSDFIHSQSSFMKHRSETLDASLVEVMATLRGETSARAQVARAAMAVHRWADFLGTHGLWLGKFQQMTESGSTVEQAVREADKAIRQTQTAGAPKDLSAFERDPTYKAFRMFLGPMLIMGNRIRESVGRKGVIKGWPEAFGTLFAVWFVPALLWEIATGKGPDDDDEPADMVKWALRKTFFYPFMTVPFLRDIGNGVERLISGEYSPSRSVPLVQAGELVTKAGHEWIKAGSALAEGDEVDTQSFIKDNLRATGPLLGLPANQLDITGQYLFDVFSGEYDPEGVQDIRYLAVKRKAE